MKSVTKALQRMIAQHEAYPAIVMDRYWNILLTNDAAPQFFNCFVDMSKRPSPRNLLHLMFDPNGMRPFIANWEVLAKNLPLESTTHLASAIRGAPSEPATDAASATCSH